MNVITGLPRSGSTLLCNILNQNPRLHASSTSVLHGMMTQLVTSYSQSPEVQGSLARDRDGTEERLRDMLRSIQRAWYRKQHDKVVFDKSRGWTHDVILLKDLFPKVKIVITVRDLREVLASIEKQHQHTPLFNGGKKPLLERMNIFFSPTGIVGGPLAGVRDIIERGFEVFWCRYEDLAAHPEQMLQRLYCFLEEEPYEHDFQNVKNTATDPDYLYNNKFPHKGSGEVKPSPITWPKYMSPDTAANLMGGFAWYNKVFGYEFNSVRQMRLPDVASIR